MADGKISVGIHGATGRMGVRLIQLLLDDPALRLGVALSRTGHARLGEDAGTLAARAAVGVPLAASIPADCRLDVMIDFSLPPAGMAIAQVCADRRIPLVVGTTGFDSTQLATLREFGAGIPILISPNMSRAVNLLMKLAAEAARSAGGAADIAIVERHHRTKLDAPSGTALRLAEVIDKAREDAITGSGREAGRPVNVHALRIGDSPGEHTVIFGFLGETVELSHRAFNRDCFVRGALEAAKFLAAQPAGVYSMHDVIA